VSGLIDQLKQRRIWRVLIAYPSVTFVLLQAVEFFVNHYGVDERLLTATLIAAVVMLPAAVIWNWRHGERGTQPLIKSELAAYLVFGVAALLAAGGYWTGTTPGARPVPFATAPLRSVAVMPFVNASGDATVQYLCDGIAESLTNWLATVENIRTISKTATFRLRESADDTAAIREQLGADSVVRGRLEKIGDQIVISASLVDARDDSQLWGERLVQPLSGIIELERAIVAAIKQGLQLEIVGDASHAASGGTGNPEAYNHYLRGHFLIQATDLESIAQGLDELRAAIALDPKFALPYADIGDALSQMIYYGIYEGEALTGEARSAAFSAVALAPDLPEAQVALGNVHAYITHDWRAAEEAYEKAIALDPQTPAPYHRYADFLYATARFERSRSLADRAVAIDPLDGSSMHAVGITAYYAGDFAAAAKAFGEWNRFHPQSRWSYIKHAYALARIGRCDESLPQLQAGMDLTGRPPSGLMLTWIAGAHQVCGREEQYAAALRELDALIAEDPQRETTARLSRAIIDGRPDDLRELARKLVADESPLVIFLQLPLFEQMGYAVTPAIRQDAEYLALIESLNFPASIWGQ